jgi:hypothetical protein
LMRSGYGIKDIVDGGVGKWLVVFETPMDNIGYSVVATCDNGSSSVATIISIDKDSYADPMRLNWVALRAINALDAGPSVIDPEFISIQVFGGRG